MEITFQGKVRRWESNESFFFVSLPLRISREIREMSQGLTNGFGSLKVEATIGTTIWRTSIFPVSKNGAFDLPLKKEIRKAHNLKEGSTAKIELKLLGFS